MEYLKVLRSSHLSCSIKKVVLKKLTNSSGKHLCWSLFLTKYITTCFPVKFTKFLRAPFLANFCKRLRLGIPGLRQHSSAIQFIIPLRRNMSKFKLKFFGKPYFARSFRIFSEFTQKSQKNLTILDMWFTVFPCHHAKLPEAANFIKKRFWHRCFPVNFAKFLRTPVLQNIFGRLPLNF